MNEGKEYLKGREMYYCVDCGVKNGKGQKMCENCNHNKFEVHYMQGDVFSALEM